MLRKPESFAAKEADMAEKPDKVAERLAKRHAPKKKSGDKVTDRLDSRRTRDNALRENNEREQGGSK
jgi:hypothetical protein